MQNKAVAIGIDVGGTKLLAGLVDADGKILSQRRSNTRPLQLLVDMSALAAEMLAEAGGDGFDVLGIGVGMKGAIDAQAGRLSRSITLGLEDLAVVDTLQERLNLPAFLENDVHAGTLGEMQFGLGRRHRDFIMFNAGTGIAAGFVLGGQLYGGASGKAGEIGHMVVCGNTELCCSCGRMGCLEDMIHRARRGEPIPLAPIEALADMPPGYQLLALGLANLVNAFNPSAVACMGGMLTDPVTIAALGEAVRRLVLQPAAEALAEVAPAFGGYQAGLLGAGSLPFLRHDRTMRLSAS